MKKDYDNLTPAQKARLTRTYNKLNEQRIAASTIQWEAYNAKRSEVFAEVEPKVKEIQAEAQARIETLREQIKAISAQADNLVAALRMDAREECKTESDAWTLASDSATKWHNEKWEAAKDDFWKELSYAEKIKWKQQRQQQETSS